jgi:hypothetical protein
VVTQFEIWMSGASDLIVVLSIRTAAVLAHSNFGRRIEWTGKRCPTLLNFCPYGENTYVYLSTKLCDIWICGLRAVYLLPGDINYDISFFL